MGPFRAPEDNETITFTRRQESMRYELPIAYPPSPRQLRTLVAELTVAFKEERAHGAVLNNHQDPTSFKRLNEKVHDLLQAYCANNCGDWRRYAIWGEHSYLRHLLWATDEFELMVLCWKSGQESRVHNHADSHCWLAVLDGQVWEQQYQPVESGENDRAPAAREAGLEAAAGDLVRLVPTKATNLHVGDVAYINDRIALHAVGCQMCGKAVADGATGACEVLDALACTLHVYCPPIRRVKSYEGGKVTESTPGFFSRHSVRGR